ncbi:hypothetical protein [Methanococcus voltae]|uniref:Uncharacterized protein n=1 Tax=Methanococcus voltae TaxID=2188 RepID=A0A8J7RDP7_METVO|nr:hypothetical protein [Methanococcus voltae]MBP2173304.1 hypothetical protein [Methanococcus voltae]MBP2201362.1 hypothetical protein [Methanococcus voltae]
MNFKLQFDKTKDNNLIIYISNIITILFTLYILSQAITIQNMVYIYIIITCNAILIYLSKKELKE